MKDKKKIIPVRGYLLLKPLEIEDKTPGGIYIPDAAKEKLYRGKVYAVGSPMITYSGVEIKSPAKLWDIVIYKRWEGTEIEHEKIKYIIVSFDSILGVFEKHGK